MSLLLSEGGTAFARVANVCCRSFKHFFICKRWVSYTEDLVPRRSFLYLPGNDERKIRKATSLKADCVVLDCEDAVAFNRKEEARNMIHSVLGKLDFGSSELCVRINSITSGLAEQDLNVILSGDILPDTIVVPKVEMSADIAWGKKLQLLDITTLSVGQDLSLLMDNYHSLLDNYRLFLADILNMLASLDETEVSIEKLISEKITNCLRGTGQTKKIGLITQMESPVGLINLTAVCQQGVENDLPFRWQAIIFGSDDFLASIGGTRTKDARELMFARQSVVTHAKAYGLQAIDMVFIDYKDLEGLKEQSEEGARMGYTGKQIIHPSQIEVVNKAFSPSKEQIEWAKNLLEAFGEQEKAGKGAISYQGNMIDMPTVLQARNVIKLADIMKKN